ncbi:hypothetical protein [Celeribacter halophilus]|uniref:hypothetical protein n=1 Tax=Celeribacter halophilus TaxID=576117 RepID=UPI003A9067B2
MSRHGFDPQVAKIVGLNAAVVFQNITFWCERNAIKGRNVYDGNAWTYNSITDFEKLFEYLTAKQIRTALDKLTEANLLICANYNEDARDRTKWYALNLDLPFAHLVLKHLPKRAETFAQKGEPLPDSKPDNKLYPLSPKGEDGHFTDQNSAVNNLQSDLEAESDLISEGFEEFWKEVWPRHKRKASKPACEKKYRMACEGNHLQAEKVVTPDELNNAAKRYIASVRNEARDRKNISDDLTFLKAPLAWLNGALWEPFVVSGGAQGQNRGQVRSGGQHTSSSGYYHHGGIIR